MSVIRGCIAGVFRGLAEAARRRGDPLLYARRSVTAYHVQGITAGVLHAPPTFIGCVWVNDLPLHSSGEADPS